MEQKNKSYTLLVSHALAFSYILLLIKVILTTNHIIDSKNSEILSFWTPMAMLYQDLPLLLCFFLLLVMLQLLPQEKQTFLSSTLYYILILYMACNIPFTRVFSTPITFPMFEAAGGAISDSFFLYVTPTNTFSVGIVCWGAFALKKWTQHQHSKRHITIHLVLWLVLFVSGPHALSKVETLGLHRNAWVTLAKTAWKQKQQTTTIKTKVTLPALPKQTQKVRNMAALKGLAKNYNVMWVNLESTGASYLKPYGAKKDPMPNLTKLVKHSLLVEHAYASFPSSIKGLYSMICGQPPAPYTKTSIYKTANLHCKDIASQLKQHGYKTAMIHSGWFHYLGMDDIVQQRGFDKLIDAGMMKSPHRSSFGIDEQTSVKEIGTYLDTLKSNEKFFLMYLPITGHHPYNSPGKHTRKFGMKDDFHRYLGDLHFGDQALGSLIRLLKQKKRFHKTIWVIMGDHGQAFFQHRGNFAHSLFIYEENIRVPLFFVLPKIIKQQIRLPQIASLTDVAPTLLELLGIQIPQHYQGQSILSSGKSLARFFTDQAVFQVGLRYNQWKFIQQPTTGRKKLFDLRTDPQEKKNRAKQHPALVTTFEKHLEAWRKKIPQK